MMIDPENPFEEWSDEVWAKTLEEARALCQKKTGEELTEVLNVTQKTRRPSKKGEYLFICWFRAETTEESSQ